MCHGLTSSKEGRRNQLKTIAEKLCNDGYKVIQFDWRGHGKSSGTDIDVNLTGFQTSPDNPKIYSNSSYMFYNCSSLESFEFPQTFYTSDMNSIGINF